MMAFEDEAGNGPGEVDVEDYPTLIAVARFARGLDRVSWFAAVGEPLSAAERVEATDYLAALGFPEAEVATVETWEEAEWAARDPDWNTAWWEAEEQLRAALITSALSFAAEHDLMSALADVTTRASSPAAASAAVAAARAGVADEALVRAAAGAAIQASYQAALVLAAGAEPEHPFAVKFRLYEAGRWPLGIVGASFNLF